MKTSSIPEQIVVNVLSRWVDWSDIKNPIFRFIVEVVNGNQRMSTEYSGGILAFIDWNKSAKELALLARNNSTVRLSEAIKAINFGKKLVYNPMDKGDIATQAINWLFSKSVVDPKGVLYSLLSDSQAGSESFEEFCSNFGYENDSRKAYKTWEACVKNSNDFKRVCGVYIGEIEKALEDY